MPIVDSSFFYSFKDLVCTHTHTQYISTISLSRSDTPCAPEVDEDVEDFPFEATAESRAGPAMATTFTEVWKPAPPAQKSAGPTSRRDPRVEDF